MDSRKRGNAYRNDTIAKKRGRFSSVPSGTQCAPCLVCCISPTAAGSFTVNKKERTSFDYKKDPFRGLLLCSRCLPLHDLKNALLQQTRPAFAFPLANRRKVMAAETPSDTAGASQMPVSPKSAANSIPIRVIPTEPRNKDKNCEYFGNSIAEK